jgi:AraC-like DNA-binding protein
VPIGSTVIVFVIGYFQLAQAEIFPAPQAAAAPPPPPVAAEPAPRAQPAYARARLEEADGAALEARIRSTMTDRRLYLEAGLTLAELADHVAATPHEVSQVLSTRMARNFYTYINEHRIEHVKAALVASDRAVLDLAFEAGFRSKSTFNTAFRKATGMTPREFRERASR